MKARFVSGLLFALLVLTWPAQADEAYDKLVEEFQAAEATFMEKIRELQLSGKFDPATMPEPPHTSFGVKFREYAEANAGKPAAVPALIWLVNNPSYGPMGPDMTNAKWAMAQLSADHAAAPELRDAMQNLTYAGWMLGREPIVELCERVIEENKDKSAKAGAMYVLGVTLYDESIQGGKPDPKRAEKLFRSLAADYKDTDWAAQADGFLFELDKLQVGMKAPEIIGKDIDGNDIMLSQFAGEVVVLDFWGFW